MTAGRSNSIRYLGSLALATLLLFPTVVLAADDPFIGLWVLDVASSQYPSGTCPESMQVEMKPSGSGVQYRSDATYPGGRTVHSEYAADYNGNQAIVMGNHGMMLPVFLKRIDSHWVRASYTKSLQVVAISERVLSPDGLKMTITTTSSISSDEKVTTIAVFHKVR